MTPTPTSGKTPEPADKSAFRCHVCGHGTARLRNVNEVLSVEGHRVLVENLPAQVCELCGEPVFSAATTERVRRLVHGEGRPARTVPLGVFEFA